MCIEVWKIGIGNSDSSVLTRMKRRPQDNLQVLPEPLKHFCTGDFVQRIAAVLSIMFSFCSLSSGQVISDRASVEVMVLCAPTPLSAEGKLHLVYEVHITNFGSKDLTLRKLQVFGDKSPAPLAAYQESTFEENIRAVGRSTSEPARLGGGQRLVFFVWATLGKSEAIPSKLWHRLTFDGFADDNRPVKMTVDGGETLVGRGKVALIQAPLHGGLWRAGGGPSNDSPHRRAVMAVDGRAYDAQRFAIDWVKLGPDGKMCRGDCSKNEDFYAYGSEVLAVEDGMVTEVTDGIPENTPGSVRRLTFETGLGNHVVLDLGAGNYAFYAHMQPGKMRVKVGDRVLAGQILGLVGNSGNARGPHLHFHLMDRPSPLASEGLPYGFEKFEVDGHIRTNEMPLADTVVRFLSSR
jgi:murein DD-endopeptidase